MKNNTLLYTLLAICFTFTSCGNDDWGNNNPEMEHIYYYGLGNSEFPGGNELVYTVKGGETIAIPTYFFSAFKRPYSPVVSYYTAPIPQNGSQVEPQLACGTDYQVVNKQGHTLAPDNNHGYSMTWPNALQGCQHIYIKALNGQKGKIRVLTFDPEKTIDPTDVSSTTIVKTAEYEVRAFSENYYVTVAIE